MAMTTKDFTTLVQESVAAIQGKASGLLDLNIGSVLRAVVEGYATVVLWLQGLILQLLATTRAATCNGADLDSFYADFYFYRLGAVNASGIATFSRFTDTAQALLPVGAAVLTADGTQTYTVIADASNPAYSASQNGYVLLSGVSSINVTVTASNAGIAGNAQIGEISLINQPIPGVDTVTNAAAFTNGVDAELDPAFRLRFQSYIASLSKATKASIGYVIASLKQGITYTLTENVNYAGAVQMGYFYAVIDDGTGSPPSDLLASAANAIETTRPFTSTYGVFATTSVPVNISMSITTAAGYSHPDVVAMVVAALSLYVNTLARNPDQTQKLAYSRMDQIAYNASPGVTNVTGVVVNGGTVDITVNAKQTMKAGTVSVT